jgi:hypothetical protein
MNMAQPKKKPEGPEPETPKQPGDWVQAVQNALKKKKAGGGFPEPPGRYGNKKTRLKS